MGEARNNTLGLVLTVAVDSAGRTGEVDGQSHCGQMQYLGIMGRVPCTSMVYEVKWEIPDETWSI